MLARDVYKAAKKGELDKSSGAALGAQALELASQYTYAIKKNPARAITTMAMQVGSCVLGIFSEKTKKEPTKEEKEAKQLKDEEEERNKTVNRVNDHTTEEHWKTRQYLIESVAEEQQSTRRVIKILGRQLRKKANQSIKLQNKIIDIVDNIGDEVKTMHKHVDETTRMLFEEKFDMPAVR